jgi:hypothetical protein
MTNKASRLLHLACSIALLTLVPFAPARADFFDDARRTFQTDIPNFFQNDVPHFFQDDVPCAFGGKPTSGARTSCSSDHPAKHAPGKAPDHGADPADKTSAPGDASPSSDR